MALAFIFESVGVGEWIVLLAVLLVVVGPKRLPEVARSLARRYAKIRRAGERFMRELMESSSDVEKFAEDAFRIDGDEGKAVPLEVRAGGH